MACSLRRSALVAALALSSFIAPAAIAGENNRDDGKGFYAVLGIGVEDKKDTDWDTNISSTAYGGEAHFDTGWVGDVGVGYDLGGVRLEASYVKSDENFGDCTDEKQSASVECAGALKSEALMGNVYLDIPIGIDNKLEAYVGAGAGVTKLKPVEINIAGTDYYPGDEKALTYQLKMGLSYLLTEKGDVFLEGVYKRIDASSFDTDIADVVIDVDPLASWSLRGGARLRF